MKLSDRIRALGLSKALDDPEKGPDGSMLRPCPALDNPGRLSAKIFLAFSA